MKLLLDTHIALWSLTDDARLSEAARALILDPENDIQVSAATLWEIAIKHGLGRGDMPVSGQEALGYFQESGYRLLAVLPEHAAAAPAPAQDDAARGHSVRMYRGQRVYA